MTLSGRGLFLRSLREREEGETQGTPLKPRQGPRPWTPLQKNLYLKGATALLPEGEARMP